MRYSPAILALWLGFAGLASAAEADRGAELGRVVGGFSGLVGQVRVDRLTYSLFPPARNLGGQVRMEDGAWHFENMTAEVAGGRAVGGASILFLKDDRILRISMSLVGARLEEVCRHFNYPIMPGSISGTMEITANSDGSVLHGEAEVQLRNANLGELPFAIKALSFLFFGFPEMQRQRVSQADAKITITPRGIVFQDLSIRTEYDAFQIVAERAGRIGYDGQVDMYFRPIFPEGIDALLPVVRDVMNAIRQRGGRLRVTGDVTNPRFSWGALR